MTRVKIGATGERDLGLPPAAHVVVPEVLSLSLDDVPESKPPEVTDPAICVVDSGILEGHPVLEAAIVP